MLNLARSIMGLKTLSGVRHSVIFA